MKTILTRLKSRMGDFWWYSLMIFCACRAADFINAFIGLYLVPKYIPQSELGAVMPLANFANFLAIPIAAFAMTFRNEISSLALKSEYGKLKSLICGVFTATGVFLILAAALSHFILPLFLERIRIAKGSLGIVILIGSFIAAFAPIFSFPLQALKKFKTTAVINVLSAPIRLVSMLATMPLRAITGYFVGQASIPSFSTVASLISLKKELSYRAEQYWSAEIARRFGKMLLIFMASLAAYSFATLVESIVLRQRLSELDSAAYYMATRFSDISQFLYITLAFTIFPFSADLASKGKSMRPLIIKASAAVLASSSLLAVFFVFTGEYFLGLLPGGSEYAAYWWAIPWAIGINMLSSITGLYATAMISANNFSYMKWMIPLNISSAIALLLLTGHGYYSHYLPASISSFLRTHNITTLNAMLCWLSITAAARLIGCIIHGTGKTARD